MASSGATAKVFFPILELLAEAGFDRELTGTAQSLLDLDTLL